jgi:NAD(P)-dependent dehydrogenase (short-subunit alcohol dehydrogenase family)
MEDRSDSRRAVLVTGASYGVGAATAVAFAQAGFDVALTATHTGNLEHVVPKLKSIGVRALPLALDLRSQASIDQVISETLSVFGYLDTLVNNAGTTLRGSAVDIALEDWCTFLDINLTGTFFLTQRFGRHLIGAGRRGSVVNITSTHGMVGVSGRLPYGVCKAALNHMTKMLSIEWADHGIRVNAVAPGRILTESPARARTTSDPQYLETMLKRIPLHRMVTAEEVAAAALFLAGPQAAAVTGQILVMDGGLTVE